MDILPPSPPLQTHILALHIDQSTGHNKTNGTSAAGRHTAARRSSSRQPHHVSQCHTSANAQPHYVALQHSNQPHISYSHYGACTNVFLMWGKQAKVIIDGITPQ